MLCETTEMLLGSRLRDHDSAGREMTQQLNNYEYSTLRPEKVGPARFEPPTIRL